MNLLYFTIREGDVTMSRIRRTFSPEFKSKLVLRVITGEGDINSVAIEHEIQPNLLRKWKQEFLANAASVFDENKHSKLEEKLKQEQKDNAAYARKVGQLTMEVDWLKKKSAEILGPDYEEKYTKKPFDD